MVSACAKHGGHPAVDDDDGIVVAADSAYTVVAGYSSGLPAAAVIVMLPAPPAVTVLHGRGEVERPSHSPPRAPSGLRAPPAFSLL
jgi:hypothetical protein